MCHQTAVKVGAIDKFKIFGVLELLGISKSFYIHAAHSAPIVLSLAPSLALHLDKGVLGDAKYTLKF